MRDHFSKESKEETLRTQVLVIGAGLGGCVTALVAADAGMDVVLVSTKTTAEDCSTGRAQGGIIYKGEKDSPAMLARDTWKAGCERGFIPAIRTLSALGPKYVERILLNKLSIPFNRNTSDHLDLTAEGAHSVSRIIHASDMTGSAIHEGMMNAVLKNPRIHLYSGVTAIDLLTTGHSSVNPQDVYKKQECFGAYVFDGATKKVHTIVANETVLATGGVGGLYLHSTNSEGNRGDGIAMAHRAGVRTLNMHYIQFHPTGLYHPTKQRFLLSEALRGEGAVLVNHKGERFMSAYHPLADLAPRDVVVRAIYDQMEKHKTHFVYLDISQKKSQWIKKRFPQISQVCREYGYDLEEGPVPVVPVAHYTCGGVFSDLRARTSLSRLRAVGEVSCTGLHGANRLASTSLLECVVWGVLAAEDIVRGIHTPFNPPEFFPWQYQHQHEDMALIYQDWQTLRNTLWNYVGPVRSPRRLDRANMILTNLRFEIENFYKKAELSEELIGLRNGIETALLILHEAMRNLQSLGCHYYVKQ